MNKIILITVLLCTHALSFVADINFRSTEVYIADGEGETFANGTIFPVEKNGLTFGWTTDRTATDRNKTMSKGSTFAGHVYCSHADSAVFVIKLPHSGKYRVNFFLSDPIAETLNNHAYIMDSLTILDSVVRYGKTEGSVGIDTAMDINSQKIAYSNIAESQKKIFNFESTELRITIGKRSPWSGSTNINNIYIDDSISNDCDTLHAIGFIDSTKDALIFQHEILCAGMDSTATVWGDDTTNTDTIWHAGPYNSGITILDTLLCFPSTKYYARTITDSSYQSPWYTAWTANDTDSVQVEEPDSVFAPIVDTILELSGPWGRQVKAVGHNLDNLLIRCFLIL